MKKPPLLSEHFDLIHFAQTRRQFIKTFGAVSIAGLDCLANTAKATEDLEVIFSHGVASGDPLSDRVIIWSRAFSPKTQEFDVQWLVATDPGMLQIVNSGVARASAQFDYTLKIDVPGLTANTVYYYQFRQGTSVSPVGQTRTLAAVDLNHCRLAVVSCSNYEKGYFNVYAEIGKMQDIDVVIHLGDYIYEYGPDEYLTPGNTQFNIQQPRVTELKPSHEIVNLADYRTRYALYRSDTDLQELHRLKPFIAVWDDHEVANDAWKNGAENHNPENGEGEWLSRRNAAIQAYYEWLPIREPSEHDRLTLYRSFNFGNLARLIMLDTRMIARDQQLSSTQMLGVYQTKTSDGQFPLDKNTDNQPRELLGTTQKNWLINELQSAAEQQSWQIIGQQILFEFQNVININQSPHLTEAQKQLIKQLLDAEYGNGAGTLVGVLGTLGGPNPLTTDMWTGYPSAKRELAQILANTPNPVILAGDSHNAWAANLTLSTSLTSVPVGVEMATPSVSAPGIEELLPIISPETLVDLLHEASQNNSTNDPLVYAQMAHRGFIVVDITHDRVQGEWYFVDNVFSKNYQLSLGKILAVAKNTKQYLPVISALFANNRLLIPVVEVLDRGRFAVEMVVSNKENTQFELTLVSANVVSDKSVNPASFSFEDKLLKLPIVSFAGKFYSASLEFVEGSEPMRFNQLSYQEYQ